MRHLFWLPTDIFRNLQLLLPRQLFVRVYSKSSDVESKRELMYRNSVRRMAYEAKRRV